MSTRVSEGLFWQVSGSQHVNNELKENIKSLLAKLAQKATHGGDQSSLQTNLDQFNTMVSFEQ